MVNLLSVVTNAGGAHAARRASSGPPAPACITDVCKQGMEQFGNVVAGVGLVLLISYALFMAYVFWLDRKRT